MDSSNKDITVDSNPLSEFTNCFTNCLLFCVLASKAPPLGECRRGRGYFWILPDACGLRPCVRTHFKKGLCCTCPVVGWRINKVEQQSYTGDDIALLVLCNI